MDYYAVVTFKVWGKWCGCLAITLAVSAASNLPLAWHHIWFCLADATPFSEGWLARRNQYPTSTQYLNPQLFYWAYTLSWDPRSLAIRNRHDTNIHTLNPTDNGICQAKMTEFHPSNISWYLLLAKIFNSSISARAYHGQHVAISVLCNTNQFEPQPGHGAVMRSFIKRFIILLYSHLLTLVNTCANHLQL